MFLQDSGDDDIDNAAEVSFVNEIVTVADVHNDEVSLSIILKYSPVMFVWK